MLLPLLLLLASPQCQGSPFFLPQIQGFLSSLWWGREQPQRGDLESFIEQVLGEQEELEGERKDEELEGSLLLVQGLLSSPLSPLSPQLKDLAAELLLQASKVFEESKEFLETPASEITNVQELSDNIVDLVKLVLEGVRENSRELEQLEMSLVGGVSGGQDRGAVETVQAQARRVLVGVQKLGQETQVARRVLVEQEDVRKLLEGVKESEPRVIGALLDIIHEVVKLGEVLRGGEDRIKALDALIQLVKVIQENKEELKELFDIVRKLDKDLQISQEAINSLLYMFGLDSIGEAAGEDKSGVRGGEIVAA